jgi:hypothetical protein
MNQNTLNNILLFVVLFVLGVFAYFYFTSANSVIPVIDNGNVSSTTGQVSTTTSGTATTTLQYVNNQYGFSFDLPVSWQNYTVVNDFWKGNSLDANGNVIQNVVIGPMISLRHPNWTYSVPRQDIPIMIFTISQWNDMQNDKFHIGAAPINPSELGRNSKYVFALPARYNYSYLPGYEEVDKLIQAHSLKAFNAQ